MKIKFIYTDSEPILNRELVVNKLLDKIKNFIELPNYLEIEFADTADHIYGETHLNQRFKNRIKLSHNLEPDFLIKTLLHELIHINQLYTGILRCRQDGIIYWKNNPYRIDLNTITYSEWQKLPWELDVVNKQHNLLLKLKDTQNLT